jgi:aminoglycoside phosphotransferase
MDIPDNISKNLRFLISEVSLQINNLQIYLKNPSLQVAGHILERSGYSYNLKKRIQEECSNIRMNNKKSKFFDEHLKAFEVVASDLEQIAILCRNCVEFVLQDGVEESTKRCLFYKKYRSMLEHVNKQLSKVEISIYNKDTKLALKIGVSEKRFKKINKKLQKKFPKNLKHKKCLKSFMSSVSLLNSLTQMGSVLLSISETILSANLGQTISTERYYSLKNSVEQWWDVALKDVEVKTIAETRSGSGISGINTNKNKTNTKNNSYDAIFKDGKKQKLKEEKQSVESWHEIFPGLAPKIIDYKKQGDSASILIEHLPGLTYEQILLHESKSLLAKTQKDLCTTLKKIWVQTYSPKKISGGYIEQLQKRLNNVYSVHPEFQQLESTICGYKIPALNKLLDTAKELEKKSLSAPFSVYIHGDFNVDNIIYDPQERKINFIDLHRSRYMDYVQDISVFMVSHYRLQSLSPELRKRILQTSSDFYLFSTNYAKKMKDDTFNLRLALALARSFLTSTRFILDKTLAKNMFVRARYLIELVIDYQQKNKGKKPEQFELSINEIFTG